MFPPGMDFMFGARLPGMPGMTPDDGGEEDETPDPRRERRLRNSLRTAQDSSEDPIARVKALHLLCKGYGFGSNQQEFVRCGGIRVLVDLAVNNWPRGGALAASACPEDAVAVVRPDMHHSVRRVAVGTLAEMSNYRTLVAAMHSCGLFDQIPPMLADLAPRYRYGQSYRRFYGRGRGTDQGQFVYERLVSACANALRFGADPVRSRIISRVLWPVVAAFPLRNQYALLAQQRDPTAAVLDKPFGRGWDDNKRLHATDRDAVDDTDGDNEDTVEGLDENVPDDPMMTALQEMMDSVYNVTDDLDSQVNGSARRLWRMPDPLAASFVRLVSNALNCIGPEATQRLLLQEHIIAKLILVGNELDPTVSNMKQKTIGVLTQFWMPLEQREGAALLAHEQALAGHADVLRQAGNAAFREGLLGRALQLYTAAVALNWDEPTLRNNRCLTLLRLSRCKEARWEAIQAVACDARNSKSWCRLGDAFKACGQVQCAALCYRQALELVGTPGGDPDVQDRLQGAQHELGGAARCWRWQDVPDRQRDSERWLAWMRPHVSAQLHTWLSREAFMPGELESVPARHLDVLAEVDAYQASTALRYLRDLATAMTALATARVDATGRMIVTWTDTDARAADTGLALYTLSVSLNKGPGFRAVCRFVEGKPRTAALRAALYQAMAFPAKGEPCRPAGILLPHRALPYVTALRSEFERYGIAVVGQTEEHAGQDAELYDRHPEGLNHLCQYRDMSFASAVPTGGPAMRKPKVLALELQSDDEDGPDQWLARTIGEDGLPLQPAKLPSDRALEEAAVAALEDARGGRAPIFRVDTLIMVLEATLPLKAGLPPGTYTLTDKAPLLQQVLEAYRSRQQQPAAEAVEHAAAAAGWGAGAGGGPPAGAAVAAGGEAGSSGEAGGAKGKGGRRKKKK